MVPSPEIHDGAAGQELSVSFSGDQIDIRIFDQGAGPARVRMPTKRGLTVPLALLPGLIITLQSAEVKARALGLIGGGHA